MINNMEVDILNQMRKILTRNSAIGIPRTTWRITTRKFPVGRLWFLNFVQNMAIHNYELSGSTACVYLVLHFKFHASANDI